MSRWCVTVLLLAACGPVRPGPGNCDVKPVAECPATPPVYTDVKPLFTTHCNSCHGTRDDLWDLDTYEHIADWQLEVRAEMLSCAMPPADSTTGMTLEEKQTILTWIRCGAPR